jgi:hypothetical protein
MQLREAGVSFEKIAETLGYRNRSSARKAVLAGLKAARQSRRSSCGSLSFDGWISSGSGFGPWLSLHRRTPRQSIAFSKSCIAARPCLASTSKNWH